MCITCKSEVLVLASQKSYKCLFFSSMHELIKQLLEKTKMLAEKYQQQVKKNNELEIQLAELKQKLAQQNETLKDLEERNKILKLAKSLNGNTDENILGIKLKINELVKEIDKCVALLNR